MNRSEEQIVRESKSLSDLGRPAMSFRGDLVRQLKRPCVYLWMRGSEVLYVGKGSNGSARPFDGKHHRLKAEDIEDSDVLLIWACEEGAEMLLEGRLIKELNPKLNHGQPDAMMTDIARGKGYGGPARATEKPYVAMRRLASALKKAKNERDAAQRELHYLLTSWRIWSEIKEIDASTIHELLIEMGKKPRNGYTAILAMLRLAM